jgi:hypothetical protein
VELVVASGVWLRDEQPTRNEIISTLVAQENAQAMLTEARVRKEKEKLKNMDKEKQLIIRERREDVIIEGVGEGDFGHEDDEGLCSVSPVMDMQLRKVVRKRRVGVG